MVYYICMVRGFTVCLCVSGFGVLQVGNLGLLFMLLFFIYAALGVELFGELGEYKISSRDAIEIMSNKTSYKKCTASYIR